LTHTANWRGTRLRNLVDVALALELFFADAVFRTLFRGREDVYPRRFESRKTGKSGYAPACQRVGTRHL